MRFIGRFHADDGSIATHYDARIRCSLDVVGISNSVTFLQDPEPWFWRTS